MKIKIIDNIFIEKGILQTYGRDGNYIKVFLRQGNFEGRRAVYSLMMLLIINEKDWLDYVIFFPEELKSILPFELEEQDSNLPF